MRISPRHVVLWPLAVVLASTTACRRTADPESQGVSLVVSGDTAGWIMPCGCASGQSGGLARRASYVEHLRETRDVMVADVGGAPGGASPYDVAKFTAILRGELAMGIKAHNIGAAEAALGGGRLRDIAAQTGAPFVSANVRDAQGAEIAPKLRIVRAGGMRLALVGVLSPKLAPAELVVADPADAVLDALSERKGQYDAAVVLAYLPLDELEALARALPEVDLVIGGPTRQSVEPRRVGQAVVAAVTNKGKFLARLDANAGAGRPSWSGTIVEVAASLPDDAEQLANLRGYQDELAKRDFSAPETPFAPLLPDPLPESYQIAGSAACQECHPRDCQSWAASRHAHAWEPLVEHHAQVDSYCQQCHTTGFGLPGGFVSAGRTVERASVGCESCHGPALAHVKQPTSRTLFVARDECLRCHDRDNSPDFAYDAYWEQIRHGEAQPAARASAALNPLQETSP